jgi:hypothetical protein
MTSSQGQKTGSAMLPDVVAQLQGTIESLYLSRKALEQDVKALRATQPVLLGRTGRAALPVRVLLRISAVYRRRHNVQTIRGCGLFDAQWYLETYGDVREAGLDPALHFLMFGSGERRDPGPFFDTGHYLRLYPDIAQNGMNPLLHYLASGFDEQRSIRPGMPHEGGA